MKKHGKFVIKNYFLFIISHCYFFLFFFLLGGAVASWLVCSSPERPVGAWALVGDTVLCSWARHLTLIVPLSTQEYKWVPANCWGKPNKLPGNDLRWTSIPSRGSRNTPSRFMVQKPGISSGSYEPVGSKASENKSIFLYRWVVWLTNCICFVFYDLQISPPLWKWMIILLHCKWYLPFRWGFF